MDRTYKVIEVVGASEKSFAEATRNAVEQAAKTLKGLAWFEATEMRGVIKDGRVNEFQVAVKIGFRLIDNP
jgi:flavin-binding protein dodecin